MTNREISWAELPSTFLTRTIGPLTASVLDAEKTIAEELAKSDVPVDIPAEILICAAVFGMGESEDRWRAELSLHWPTATRSALSVLERLSTRLLDSIPRSIVHELVPYLMEPIAGGYRISRRQGSDFGRAARQELATYFTPGDLAAFMTREGLRRIDGIPRSVLDPCCGTGTFLRQFVRQTRSLMSREDQLLSITGIDLDARSLNIASVVLAVEIFNDVREWRRVRARLLHGDALEVARRAEHRNTYSLLLANPPYGASSSSRDRAADFEALLIDNLAEDGVGVMVVPASIATSRFGSQAEARRKLLSSGSTWVFLNYDRSPDSLFGDDVKQRCTVLVRDRGGPDEVFTSQMLRWRRSARLEILTARETVKVKSFGDKYLMPRVADEAELEVFDTLLTWPRGTGRFRRLGREEVAQADDVTVGDTAYNFVPAWVGAESLFARPGRRAYKMNDQSQALALYAVMVSRLGFWFWRSFDDGFHVSVEFVSRLAGVVENLDPRTLDALSRAGMSLREHARANLVRSVNAGKSGETPVPPSGAIEMSEVEARILGALGLPPRSVKRFLLRLGAVHQVAGTRTTNKELQ